MEEIKETIGSFMKAWKKGDWEGMYLQSQKTWMLKRYPTSLIQELGEELPVKYRVKRISMINKVVAKAVIKIYWEDRERLADVRLLKEIDAYLPRVEGSWGVNPVSLNNHAK